MLSPPTVRLCFKHLGDLCVSLSYRKVKRRLTVTVCQQRVSSLIEQQSHDLSVVVAGRLV